MNTSKDDTLNQMRSYFARTLLAESNARLGRSDNILTKNGFAAHYRRDYATAADNAIYPTNGVTELPFNLENEFREFYSSHGREGYKFLLSGHDHACASIHVKSSVCEGKRHNDKDQAELKASYHLSRCDDLLFFFDTFYSEIKEDRDSKFELFTARVNESRTDIYLMFFLDNLIGCGMTKPIDEELCLGQGLLLVESQRGKHNSKIWQYFWTELCSFTGKDMVALTSTRVAQRLAKSNSSVSITGTFNFVLL